MRHRYFGYLQKTNVTVFNIVSAIKLAKFHLTSTFITKLSFFGYVYSVVDTHWQQCVSAKNE